MWGKPVRKHRALGLGFGKCQAEQKQLKASTSLELTGGSGTSLGCCPNGSWESPRTFVVLQLKSGTLSLACEELEKESNGKHVVCIIVQRRALPNPTLKSLRKLPKSRPVGTLS